MLGKLRSAWRSLTFGQTSQQAPQKSREPWQVNNVTHEIDTGQSRPVFRKPYQIPYAYTEEFEKQIGEMLENDIIRPSKSPWNAPVILVKKKDGSLRQVQKSL